MKVYLTEMDWSILLNRDDVLEAWSQFVKIMKDLVVKFVPRKIRKTVKNPMWWNKNIQNLGRKKTRSWDRYKVDKTEGNYTSYKNALKKSTKAIRAAKRRLEKKISENIKSDLKMFFKYAGSKTRTRTGVGPLSPVYTRQCTPPAICQQRKSPSVITELSQHSLSKTPPAALPVIEPVL